MKCFNCDKEAVLLVCKVNLHSCWYCAERAWYLARGDIMDYRADTRGMSEPYIRKEWLL